MTLDTILSVEERAKHFEELRDQAKIPPPEKLLQRLGRVLSGTEAPKTTLVEGASRFTRDMGSLDSSGRRIAISGQEDNRYYPGSTDPYEYQVFVDPEDHVQRVKLVFLYDNPDSRFTEPYDNATGKTEYWATKEGCHSCELRTGIKESNKNGFSSWYGQKIQLEVTDTLRKEFDYHLIKAINTAKNTRR